MALLAGLVVLLVVEVRRYRIADRSAKESEQRFVLSPEQRLSEQCLREFTTELLHAREDERKQIARELHDEYSQQLTLIALELARLNEIANLRASRPTGGAGTGSENQRFVESDECQGASTPFLLPGNDWAGRRHAKLVCGLFKATVDQD